MSSRLAGIAVGVLLLATPLFATPIDPADPPQGLFIDEWMLVRIADQPAGYMHSTMTREGDRITTRSITVISLNRAGAPIEMTMMESSEETVAGKPLSFTSVMDLGAMQTKKTGRIVDGKVTIENEQFGMTTREAVDYPAGAWMTWGAYAEQMRRGLDPGTEYSIEMYTPSLMTNQAVRADVKVDQRETIDVLGKSVEATHVINTMIAPTGTVTAHAWLNDDGGTIKTKVSIAGMAMEMILTDEATATKEISPPEFFFQTLVESDKKIDRQAAQSLKLRLELSGEGEPMPDLPATDMQTPSNRTDSAIDLVIKRQDHDKFRQAKMHPAGDDMAEFLESNIWINSDDEKVIAMARQAVGDAKTPYEIADALRNYVTDAIEDKNLNIGFATASEVCRKLEGDCSEHGVLLAALGRVHKIPTRVVMGLVYVPWFGGAPDVFGFHMWTQFYIGGQWLDLDAAQRETDCNPTHIAVATSSLKHSSLADISFREVALIGRLKIEVIEADPADAVSEK